MLRARIGRRLRGIQAPAAWVFIARACRAAGALSRDRRRWDARTAHALRHAGRYRDATLSYLAAVQGPGGGDDASALVERTEKVGPVPDVPADWYYYLGASLYEQGDLAGALTLTRAAATQRPANWRWRGRLARLEEEAGNPAGAANALRHVVEVRGHADPRPAVQLASVHNRVGEWGVARGMLAENVARHPGHAPSHQLLGEACAAIAQWGGTFVDTLPNRAAGRFAFGATASSDQPAPGGVEAGTAAEQARDSWERAVQIEPDKPQWRAALAEARLATGDVEGAAHDFDLALAAARDATERWALGAVQRWQFQLERAHHVLGHPREEDPLFEAVVAPGGEAATGEKPVTGLFDARLGYAGMTVAGLLGSAECEHVDVLLDGRVIRSVNVSRNGHLPEFTLLIKRTTLALFPAHARLELRAPDGAPLLGPGGVERLDVRMPHGDGRLLEIVASGGTLNKKGEIRPSPAEVQHRQDRDLEIYDRVRDFFDSQLGRPIFLMYGTLLGYHRDGDFITGDDDFDAGFVCEATDPVGVKNETMDIVVRLIKAGFTVSFNRRGRLFRIQLERGGTDGCHVDVHPVWFQDGNVWVHNVVCLPVNRDEFLPAGTGTLRGVPVSVPRNPEAFLRANYGPGWTTPDPGFRYYPSELTPAVRRNLAKALITVGEYRELDERIRREVGDSATAGRLVSIGSQSLYPLDQFIA